MTPLTIDIEQWKREGAARGARAMLVTWDTYPMPEWEAYPVYVMPGESIAQRVAEFDGPNMQIVTEVHLLRPCRG